MRLLVFVYLFLTGCATQIPVVSTPPPTPTPVATPASRISLSWELTTAPRPERKPWSDAVVRYLDENFSTFDSAKDFSTFCPRYGSLSRAQKLKAWGEFWVAAAYYESGFNPASASVDVGTAADKETWSVGLFQVSVVDQAWVFGAKRYSYDQLKTALPNIDLALSIMKRQIVKTGIVALPNSSPYRYWATFLVGNKYSKIPQMKDRVVSKAPGC